MQPKNRRLRSRLLLKRHRNDCVDGTHHLKDRDSRAHVFGRGEQDLGAYPLMRRVIGLGPLQGHASWEEGYKVICQVQTG